MSGPTSHAQMAPEEMGAAHDFGDDFSDDADRVPFVLEGASVGLNREKEMWNLTVRRQRMPILSIILVFLAIGWYTFVKAPYSFFRTRKKGWLPLLHPLQVHYMGDFFIDDMVRHGYGRPPAVHDNSNPRPQLPIMIVSRARAHNSAYLPAALWFFHRAVKARRMFDWDLVVCNTDYDDLPRPSIFDRVQTELNITVYSVQERRRIRQRPLTRQPSDSYHAKLDNGGCLTLFGQHLNRTRSEATYAVVLEDDAIALDNLESSIDWMLARPEFQSKKVGYVKLWHPRNWIRYAFIFPVLVFNATISLLTIILLRRRSLRWCTALRSGAMTFGALYVIYLWLHDHTLALLMTLVPSMHSIQHAKDCCTPGMLFAVDVLSVLGEREEADTRSREPYDIVMYDLVFKEMHRLVWQLYPFAVEHIGQVSTFSH